MGVIQWLNEHWYMYVLIALAVIAVIASLVLGAVLKKEIDTDAKIERLQKQPQRRRPQLPQQARRAPGGEYEDVGYLLKQAEQRRLQEVQRRRSEPIVPGYGQLPEVRPGFEHLKDGYSLAPQPAYDKVPVIYDRALPDVVYEKLPDVILDPQQYQARQNAVLQRRIALLRAKKQ